jgi:hypothetical protein
MNTAYVEERAAITQSLPDIEDTATWPSVDNAVAATEQANNLIREAQLAVQHIYEPLYRMAREIGMLRNEIKSLCSYITFLEQSLKDTHGKV